MSSVITGVLRKFFARKVGEFLRVKEGDYYCIAGSSIRLSQAEIKEEVFDELHLPVTLRGGFIDEISINFNVPGMFSFSFGGAQIVIKNVFLVFGPHQTDWSWEHVYKCKSNLIDLVMKIYELKPRKTKRAGAEGGSAGHLFQDMQKRIVHDLKKAVLSMVQVHISNVHIRYEDALTQTTPLACGFKIGYIGVSSKEDSEQRRTTGEWRHWTERHANCEFCQSIAARRISAYWDLSADRSRLFATRPVVGEVVKRNFVRLNLRETFAACVVEKVLELFPLEHKRRTYLQGPVFRERLDFHQYVLFPASLRAEVTGNTLCDATRAQKAPLKDLDVVVDPLEIAVDSEQVRSMNQLLAYVLRFRREDVLLQSRPGEPISKYLVNGHGGRGLIFAASLGHKPAEDPEAEARQALVRAWWQHAFQGVRLYCNIPKAHMQQQELLERAKLREAYVSLFLEVLEAQLLMEQHREPEHSVNYEALRDRLKLLQMRLNLKDIFEWRLLAQERRMQKVALAVTAEEEAREDEERAAKEVEAVAAPNTLQARVRFTAFQAYFLSVADHFWSLAFINDVVAPIVRAVSGGSSNAGRLQMPPMTRQLVVKGQVLDVSIEVVQKGRSKHRIARWVELGVGSASVTNCNVRGHGAAADILSVKPIEPHPGPPVCAFLGFTSLECWDRKLEPGDAVLGAMLQPWSGLANHLRSLPKEESPEQLKRLGFLKDYKDTLGKLMTSIFVRVGHIRALDYTPFRRRVLRFLARGRAHSMTDLERRPSIEALSREWLVQLQRRVENLTGKSNMMGIVEGVIDGVHGRLVDHYNSQHVLCKEVSLAPLQWKALRNGKPQAFHLEFHQLAEAGERPQSQLLPLLSQDSSFGLLPWKVALRLLPKADFAMKLTLSTPETPLHKRSESTRPNNAELSINSLADRAVVAGAAFWKWGRNGKPKRRFVVFEEELNAVVWKSLDARQPVGAIPLSKVQDICTGVQTPVLRRVRSSRQLAADCLLSIVATDRTLDLQAESVSEQRLWVAGLRERFKRYVEQQATREDEGAAQLPKVLERRSKVYPERFRSDRCWLRNSCRRLELTTAPSA